MGISCKVINLFLGLLLINLCTGFPLNLDTSPADFRNQFLTGLIGVLLTICGIVCLIGCLCCQRHRGFKEFHNAPVIASSTSSLDHGLTNPITNAEFTIFTPLSPFHQNNVFLAHEQIVQSDPISNSAGFNLHSWFDGTQPDFPRTKLKYINELGKGWFGRVVEGTAQGIYGDDQTWTPVAVRILESTATNGERAAFLLDANIYRNNEHPHILQLLGRNLESIPLLLLQELCPKGDLKKYLLENQKTPEKILNTELPLLWCCQLSSALKHLHDHQLTHPDLAARNCQIISDLSLKLGDYGLAASLYPEDYYQGAPAVPLRWCAPESLTYTSTTIQPKQITFEGNVWSLGVTMWEIFECGTQPYAHLSDDEVISHVLGAATVRLSTPKFALLYTNYIYRLMQLCWSSYELRPSVTQIHLMVCDLIQVYKNTKDMSNLETPISVEDFDKRWSSFKPNSISRTDNHPFNLEENKGDVDIDITDISVLNLKLDKDTKTMSASLNNLHGSLDNLVGDEMDSWLQNIANKTGDMSYVRGLSEAFTDLDNTLAMENVSSSDSSYLPSPAPEVFSNISNKLEFKLGPSENSLNYTNHFDETQHSSYTESTQRTSSESETEDETWRRKVEQGAYSEKVHQKSKSVTDLMILTHIDYSESESETPLPSLDYRVNYKNVRYAPMQNLETVGLMFGSEGNLLSVHDKFQDELKRLQEERKDSLLFVPENSISNYKSEESSDIPHSTSGSSGTLQGQTSYSVNTSPSHRNSESLIEELSSPTKIQPGNQVYNIFNVRVDTSFRPNLNDVIYESAKPKCNDETSQYKEVPKLVDIIQNNDKLIDYIIARYESQTDLCVNQETSPPEQVQFDVSLTQEQLLPNSMTHSAVCLNSTYDLEPDLEFSSDFSNYTGHNHKQIERPTDVDLAYSLETWNNFLGDTLNEPRDYSSDFTSIPSESQSSLEETKMTVVEAPIVNKKDTEVEKYNHSTTSPNVEYSQGILCTNEEATNNINNWEPEVGWFLHPQSNLDVSGELDPIQIEDDDQESCMRFSMDDETMAAIRNELLLKLPQAQGHSEQVRDYEECDSEERNEIHIKYNVYTTPLSPIPEESYSESDACYYICNKEDSSDTDDGNDEWPAPFEEEEEEHNSEVANVETHSIHNVDSLGQGIQNRHTPSQDSCCSNDTLFNLDELTFGVNENESLKERSGCENEKLLKYSTEEGIKTDVFGTEKHNNDMNISSSGKDKFEIQNMYAERVVHCIITDHFNEHYSINGNLMLLVNNNNNCFTKVLDKTALDIVKTNDIHQTTDILLDKEKEIRFCLDLITNTNENIRSKSCDFHNHICNPPYCNYTENCDHLVDSKENNEIVYNYYDQLTENANINNLTLVTNDKLATGIITDRYIHYTENGSDINQNDNTTLDWELTHKANTNSKCQYIIDNNGENSSLDSEILNETVLDCKQFNENDVICDNSPVNTLNYKNIKNGIDKNIIPQTQIISINPACLDEAKSSDYITEFLDFERKNSIDSGYCKTNPMTDCSYINIDDIKISIIGDLQPQYATIEHEEHLYDVIEQESPDYNVYDVLTDIRFSGPSDIQLMSTSFSESADVDEQDWDSGSDTRSSSSGEFIWKEGEHEESVKALRAAPQTENPLEKTEPLDDIEEISSESSDDDEDIDSPEFIPSAWDKYATPSKSALRSPEKTLERSETERTKPKGVWFKKQKYHCVYEYPKEPESPIINHFEFWQPTSKSILDWEVDTSSYIPNYEGSNYNHCDLINTTRSNDYYQLNNPTSDLPTSEDEFYISSTTRPFEAFSGLSQFFPGATDHWVDLTKGTDNVTPDSGIEDITPLNDFPQRCKVQTLKILAAMALKQSHINVIKNNKAALGGLRHARNKLKLDLPPSPSAFTYSKVFTLEPPEEPITRCEVPTFTTFGKSRFMVQQVDTPSNDEDGCNNVSFEALPYKPIKPEKSKVEMVRGEASLLDSADEDSGIESSTLERRSIAS